MHLLEENSFCCLGRKSSLLSLLLGGHTSLPSRGAPASPPIPKSSARARANPATASVACTPPPHPPSRFSSVICPATGCLGGAAVSNLLALQHGGVLAPRSHKTLSLRPANRRLQPLLAPPSQQEPSKVKASCQKHFPRALPAARPPPPPPLPFPRVRV